MLVRDYCMQLREEIGDALPEYLSQIKEKIIKSILICNPSLDLIQPIDALMTIEELHKLSVGWSETLFDLGLITEADLEKYIYLDGITQGKYVGKMVEAVIEYRKNNIYLHFAFYTDNFFENAQTPYLFVGCSKSRSNLTVYNITYYSPVYALETVESAITVLADSLCLFNPLSAICLIKDKFFFGSKVINYTPTRSLNIEYTWTLEPEENRYNMLRQYYNIDIFNPSGFVIANYDEQKGFTALDNRLTLTEEYVKEYYNRDENKERKKSLMKMINEAAAEQEKK